MKKTITIMIMILTAIVLVVYKWLMDGGENKAKQEAKTEEVEKEPADEEKNVNGEAEEAIAGDKTDESHNEKE